MKKKMLIVDDNENLREALKLVFEDDYELLFAKNGEEAIQLFGLNKPDVVLMDFHMPGLSGVQAMQVLKEQSAGSQMIIMSAYDDKARVSSAFKNGAFDYVPKPFDVFQLKDMVDQAAAHQHVYQNSAYIEKQMAFEKRSLNQMIDRTLQLACC